MIQTRLGRRKSLAICTTATALSTFAFINVSEDWAVVVSSMIISASATAMYAVLCEYGHCSPGRANTRRYDARDVWDEYSWDSVRYIRRPQSAVSV